METEIKNLKKTISVSCSIPELQVLIKLKVLNNVTPTMVFRRGLADYQAEVDLAQ